MYVYIEKITTYDLDKVRSFLSALPFWQKLEGKKTILVKPNLLGAFPPERAVTTHPVVLEAVITILLEMHKEVWIGDSQGGTTPTRLVWQKTGLQKLAQKYDIRLLNFSEGGVQETKSENLSFKTTKYFWEADAVINVCKYKTHSLMEFTGAVKNLYGLIPGLKKADFHKQHPDQISFGKVISGLYDCVHERIAFSVMDGIVGMEGEGPSAGNPRNFGVIFASESASALDYIAASLMGFKPQKMEYIISAMKVDNLKPRQIEVEEKWQNFVFPNVKIQGVKLLVKILAYSPKFLRNLFRKWYQVYPDFHDGCRLCRVCVDSCPVQAMKLDKGDLHPKIDHEKCIKCMCCHELCPYSVVYVKKSFLAKFIVK